MAAAISLLTTADVSAGLLAEIRGLADDAFDDGGFSDDDWDHALGGWHVVVADEGVVLSHAAVVPRILEVGGRAVRTGYVEAVATVRGRRRRGLGSVAMAEVSTLLRAEFEMGALSTGRQPFYARLGWERWRGPTLVRHATGTIGTGEDEGVMVLRFGPSADVDLTAPISCDARVGDDW